MNAHWLNDGETVLVTGTGDVGAAMTYLVDLEPDMAEAVRERPLVGNLERGNIIPQHPKADYRWVWYASNKGRVQAVHFE